MTKGTLMTDVLIVVLITFNHATINSNKTNQTNQFFHLVLSILFVVNSLVQI